jgi:hypothetical protein
MVCSPHFIRSALSMYANCQRSFQMSTIVSEVLHSLESLRIIHEFDQLLNLCKSYAGRFRLELSDAETRYLTKLLLFAEDDTKAIDTEIARLSGMISSLENAKEDILDAANIARSMFTPGPIHKLPTDILLEIFRFVDMTVRMERLQDGKEVVGIPPLVLAGVCPIWREAVLSSPSLWSSIAIRLDEGQLSQTRMQHLSALLDRSCDVHMNLHLKFASSSKLSSIISLLRCHSHRIKQLSFDGHPPRIWEFLTSIPHFQVLDTLSVVTSASFENIIAENTGLCISAPSLRSFAYWQREMDWASLEFNDLLPWSQLNTLSLGPSNLANFFQALSECSNSGQLSKAEICFCHGDMGVCGPFPDTPIYSSTLTCLSFRIEGNQEQTTMGLCFDTLTLPKLRELEVTAVPLPGLYDNEFYIGPDKWPSTGFTAFMARSRCELLSLRLCGFPLSCRGLLSILEVAGMETLKELMVVEPRSSWYSEGKAAAGYDVSCVTTGLMERLLVRARSHELAELFQETQSHSDSSSGSEALPGKDQRIYLPNLRSLTLEGKGKQKDFCFRAFQEMVHSRSRSTRRDHLSGQLGGTEGKWHCRSGSWSAVESLKSVRLKVWSRVLEQPLDQVELDALRRLGMTIDVESSEDKEETDTQIY